MTDYLEDNVADLAPMVDLVAKPGLTAEVNWAGADRMNYLFNGLKSLRAGFRTGLGMKARSAGSLLPTSSGEVSWGSVNGQLAKNENGGADVAVGRWDALTRAASAGAYTPALKADSVIEVALDGNLTLNNPTVSGFANSVKQGVHLVLNFVQDATGGRQVTWPSNVKADFLMPRQGPGQHSSVHLIQRSDGTWRVVSHDAINVRQAIRATDWGVKADGTNDDTLPLNAFFAYARATAFVGREALLPSGGIRITNTALLGEAVGVVIRGEGVESTRLEPSSALMGKPVFEMRNCSFSTLKGLSIRGAMGAMGGVPTCGIEIRRESGFAAGYGSTKNLIEDVVIGAAPSQKVNKGISVSGDIDANNDFHSFVRVGCVGSVYADLSVDNSQSCGQSLKDCNFNGVNSGTQYGVIIGGTRDRAGDDGLARGGTFFWDGNFCGGHSTSDYHVAALGPGSNSIKNVVSEASAQFLTSQSGIAGVVNQMTLENIRYSSDVTQVSDYAIQWGWGGSFTLKSSRFDQGPGSTKFAKIFLNAISPFSYEITGNNWNQPGAAEQAEIIHLDVIAALTPYPGGTFFGIESNLYSSADGFFKWRGNTGPADLTHSGSVTTAAQTFAGAKTFNGVVNCATDLNVGGNLVISGSYLIVPTAYTDLVYAKATGGYLDLQGQQNDGAASLGVRLGTDRAFSNAASRVVAFANNKVVKSGIDPNGSFCGDASYNGAHLVFGTNHIWVDTSGKLRIKASAPTSDTDGTVVGSQS